MKTVTYQIECCIDCPFFQDSGDEEGFEARCCGDAQRDFNFPEEGEIDLSWFPDWCPLEDFYNEDYNK